jgi:hypothetical protein
LGLFAEYHRHLEEKVFGGRAGERGEYRAILAFSIHRSGFNLKNSIKIPGSYSIEGQSQNSCSFIGRAFKEIFEAS